MSDRPEAVQSDTANGSSSTQSNDRHGRNRRATRPTWIPGNSTVGILCLRSEQYEGRVSMSEYRLRLRVEASEKAEIVPAIADGTDVIAQLINEPIQVEGNVPEVHRAALELSLFQSREKTIRRIKKDLKWAYEFTLGQCSPGLREVLERNANYGAMEASQDFLTLMELITAAINDIDIKSNPFYSLYERLVGLITIRQAPNEDTSSFLARFKVAWDSLEAAGGAGMFKLPNLTNSADPNNPTDAELSATEEAFKACLFLMRGDDRRYMSLRTSLREERARGMDNYPTTCSGAISLMTSHDNVFGHQDANSHTFRSSRRNQGGSGRIGHQFLQGHGKGGRGGDSKTGTELRSSRTGELIACTSCGGNHYFTLRNNRPNPACPHNASSTGVRVNNTTTNQGASENVSDTVPTTRSYSFTQLEKRLSHDLVSIPKTWYLLDSCSTDSLSFSEMAYNVTACAPGEELTLISNGGEAYYNKIGTSKLFPLSVYTSDNTLANILSLYQVTLLPNVYVLMDTRLANVFVVVVNSIGHVFKACGVGLYYLDLMDINSRFPIDDPSRIPPSLSHYQFMQMQFTPSHQTVAQNKSQFTHRQVEGADRARELQRIMHFVSDEQFKLAVSRNHVKNCSITSDDITRATKIYGPPLPLLQGKMTWTPPDPISDKLKLQLPDYIREHHKHQQLLADIFYVNGIRFLLTKSNTIKYLHPQVIKNASKKTLIDTLRKSIGIYTARDFIIDKVTADNEFAINELEQSIKPTELEIVAANEHVGGIERSIRTTKERTRCTVQGNPYEYVTKLMTINLVYDVIDWINALPAKNGISDDLSPSNIVTGEHPPDLSKKMVPVWSYCMAYTSTTNDMKSRSVPAIVLRQNRKRGGYYCQSLLSGKKIHVHRFKTLPISQEVIDRVHQLAIKEGQKTLNRNGKKGLVFEWYPGVEIDDEEQLEENNIDDINLDDYPIFELNDDDDVTIAVDDLEDNEFGNIDIEHIDNPTANVQNDNINRMNDDITTPGLDVIIEPNQEEMEDNIIVDDIVEDDIEVAAHPIAHGDQGEPLPNDTEQDENVRRTSRITAGVPPLRLEPNLYGKSHNIARLGRQFFLKSIQSTTPIVKSYSRNDTVGPNGEVYSRDDLLQKGMGVIFTQVGAHDQIGVRDAVKRFGEEKVFAAIIKELSQLNEGAVAGKPVISPINPAELTTKEKVQALDTVNQLKLKAADPAKGIMKEELKARCCADGRKQRRYIDPDENTSSPTVSNEANLISLVIDVHEGRDVAVSDVKGAFLQAPVSVGKDGTRKVLKFRGRFAEVMAEVNEDYKKYLVVEKGKKVLYVLLTQSIYGTLDAALRWYDLYSTTLVKEGFVINPYDLCVANKIIDGKQCTISWYVDDNKISHVNPKVVDQVITLIEGYFGKMKVSRGNEHKLLGMNIYIDRENKVLRYDMKELLEEAIAKFELSGERITSSVPHPATANLMIVNPDAVPLTTTKADIFHSVTATLLHICKRTRPDLEVSLGFLTKRVQRPDEDDWKKLRRVIQYCYGTVNEKRTVGASTLYDIYTWIDAAYAVHWDMKSQTGGCISLGIGTIHTKSNTQRINVKSSTEAELVAMSEYLPYNIWMYNFLNAQGYEIKDNTIYQDNQSAIKMEKNGRKSSTGRSRHINIRYFWVKDLVDQHLVKIEYCPTELMLADFFTKPLNGSLFKYLKDFVMGHRPMSELERLTKEESQLNCNNQHFTHWKNEERVGVNTFLPVTDNIDERTPHTCADV